jgi:hypothetical protein
VNFKLEKRIWWNYIGEDLRGLFLTSQKLINNADDWKEKFQDYAFIVFPSAKAYEGFLKKIFLDLRFITPENYYGKRFRIGKALNPFLDRNEYQKESVYDKIAEYCGGKELADQLWDAWRLSRNLIFHWFPEEKNIISFQEAEERISLILNAMDAVFKECKI